MNLLTLTKKVEDQADDTDSFKFTSNYIKDELDLIQTQQENIVGVSAQLENALSHEENLQKLIKVMKEIDKTINESLVEKRKKESSMVQMLEDIKGLLKQQRYEDIDRLMRNVHKQSQLKIHMSQDQLNRLRMFMTQINQLYQEAAGFCRLSQLVYSKASQIYDICQQELDKELSEEEELSKAGSYAGTGDSRVVKPVSFKPLLGDGAGNWFKRY